MNQLNNMTKEEKQLFNFKNQLHNLLIRAPDIRLGVDRYGEIVAFIPSHDPDKEADRVYVPTFGKQESINIEL